MGVKTARNRKAIIFAFKFILSTFYNEITARSIYCMSTYLATARSLHGARARTHAARTGVAVPPIARTTTLAVVLRCRLCAFHFF